MMRFCADKGFVFNPTRFVTALNPRWNPFLVVAGRCVCAVNGSEDRGSYQGKGKVEAVEKAKSAALRLLGKRSHSRYELTQKLLKYGYQHEAITPALDRLAHVGLQSDIEFAEIFARSKWRQAKWGPSRLKMELARRKVTEDITIAAIQSVFGEEGLDIKGYVEGVEHEDVLEGHNVGAVKALLQAARARYQMTAGLSKETRKRRLFNWLQRRGHRAEDAIKILHLLEQEQISENASQDEASM